MWKPFVSRLWAALNSPGTSRAGDSPPGTIWTAQIAQTLEWLLCFLDPKRNPHIDTSGALTRTWLLSAYLRKGVKVEIVWDASPWGLGGTLLIEGKPVGWLESALTDEDVQRFHHPIGCSTGQQTWECLAPLVCLRAWKDFWMNSRAELHTSGDNVTSLEMILNGTGRGEGPSFISRELALDLGDGAYRPALVRHIPGVANEAADFLSRIHQPDRLDSSWPKFLKDIAQTEVPARNADFYHVKLLTS